MPLARVFGQVFDALAGHARWSAGAFVFLRTAYEPCAVNYGEGAYKQWHDRFPLFQTKEPPPVLVLVAAYVLRRLTSLMEFTLGQLRKVAIASHAP